MSTMTTVNSRVALAALTPQADDVAYLTEAGREGSFIFRNNNLATAVAADPQQGVYIAPANGNGSNGAWVRDLSAKALTPYHFGAVDGPGTDSATALQAFGVFIATFAVDQVDASGDFSIGTGLIWGTTTAFEMLGKTPVVRGSMRLTALEPINEMLRLRNWQECIWNGRITLTGTGGLNYASRGCHVGLALDGCRLMHFTGGISATNFAFAGVAQIPPANNNFINLGQVKCYACGSGVSGDVIADASLTSGWSGLTDSGNANSTTQRTTISGITQFFDEWVEDYSEIGNAPVQIRIDGYLYYVYEIDRTAGTATVYPWVPTNGSDSQFEWVFGGGLYLAGSDGNVVTFDKVDASTCGRGVAAAPLYGPIGSVSAQFCGTGVLIGRTPSGATLGSKLSVYMEGNSEDIVLLCPQANAGYNYLTSEYALNLAKCHNVSTPRTSSRGLLDPGFARTPIVASGRRHAYEKRPGSGFSTFSALPLSIDRRDLVIRERRNSWTVNIQPIDPDFNRLFGYSGATLIFHGTGAAGAPTGSFTFNPPAGQTVNGAASGVFSGFAGPALFSVEYDSAAANWEVRLVTVAREGRPGVASRSNSDATLTPLVDETTQRFASTLTTNRTVTLSTTGAVEGHCFSIVRPAGGAFNLNVGTGPLKAMPANSWADFEYDGSSWFLKRYGSL